MVPEASAHNPAFIGKAADLLDSALTAAGRALTHLYVYDGGQVSRPKLLATLALLDCLAIAGAGLVTASERTSWGAAVCLGCAAAILTVVILQRRWSYAIGGLRSIPAQVGKVASSLSLAFIAVTAGVFLGGLEQPQRGELLAWLVVSFLTLTLLRVAAARLISRLAGAGLLLRRTVIAGGGAEAGELIAALKASANEDVHVLGVFDDRQDERAATTPAGLRQLGAFADLAEFCRVESVDLIIVTVPRAAEFRLLQILSRFWVLPVDVRLSALGSKLPLSSRAYTYIGNVPMLAVFDKPLTDWERVVKNVTDRALAAILLILAAPVMAAVAVAIRWESRGPVLFKQKRYGFNNELIEVLKFRSMYTDRCDADAAKLVTKGDPRVTRVGRIIRKTSLDELPQLINVLKGELALVGPRPHAREAKADSELYEYAVKGYFARHRVKPGVTGWAQVNGWRGETDTKEKLERRVECDLHYIENWSVFLDLKIIAMTPFALLQAKNAY
jgi:Undecaprenyl-phosphate glucose phosphotransferase